MTFFKIYYVKREDRRDFHFTNGSTIFKSGKRKSKIGMWKFRMWKGKGYDWKTRTTLGVGIYGVQMYVGFPFKF